MSTDLKPLITSLDRTCRRALETAAELCLEQTHYNVEVEHLLIKLLELPGTDLELVFRYFEFDPALLRRQLAEAIERFDRGNSRTPAMSPQIIRLLGEARIIAELLLESPVIRSGALLLAIYEDDELRRAVVESAPILARIPHELLREGLRELVGGSGEEAEVASHWLGQDNTAGPAPQRPAPVR